MVLVSRRQDILEDDLLYGLLRYSGKLRGVSEEGYMVDISVGLCWCSFREMFLELGIELRKGNMISLLDYLDGVIFLGKGEEGSYKLFKYGLLSLDRNKLIRIFELCSDWRVNMDHQLLIERGGIISVYLSNVVMVGEKVGIDVPDIGDTDNLFGLEEEWELGKGEDFVTEELEVGDKKSLDNSGDIEQLSVDIGEENEGNLLLGVKDFDGIITDAIIENMGSDKVRGRGRPKGIKNKKSRNIVRKRVNGDDKGNGVKNKKGDVRRIIRRKDK